MARVIGLIVARCCDNGLKKEQEVNFLRNMLSLYAFQSTVGRNTELNAC